MHARLAKLHAPTEFKRASINIMRTSISTLLIVLASVFATLPAVTQAQANKTAPPTMQRLEEGEAPAVTIRKSDGGKKVTEKREQGVVTEVQVQSGKSNYKLKQSAGAGNAAAGDAQSNTVRAAQFTVKEFDLGRKPVAEKKDDTSLQPAPAAVPAPPNSTLSPAKK